MTDLLPCPFCGGEAAPYGTKWVACGHGEGCPGRGFIARPEEWNRRVPYLPPEDVETLMEIESAWRVGAALASKHGQPFTTEPRTMTDRADAFAAIIAKLTEGK